MPWLVRFDFNEVLLLEDKFGGSGRRSGRILDFQKCLDGYDLHDLWWRRYRFMWYNQHIGNDRIEERNDMFCANSACLSMFDHWQVDHILSHTSDHALIKLKFLCFDQNKLLVKNWGRDFISRSNG